MNRLKTAFRIFKEEGAGALFRAAQIRIRRGLRPRPRAPRRGPRAPRWIFTPQYTFEDNSTVTLYTDDPALFPNYRPRKPLPPRHGTAVRATLIATSRNEGRNVHAWLESLEGQSRQPDEAIFVDAGSDDGTFKALQEYAARASFPVQVISRPGLNIAQGRNLAISLATAPYITCTDFGCRLEPRWLENLLHPFEEDADMQVSAGWFSALEGERPSSRLGWADLDNLDPQGYLPSSRSVAFRKDAWERVGGYPEWLTLTGEDTYFSAELKRLASRWAFVPDASVQWEAPASPASYWRKIYQWSTGDGESGLFTQYAWWSLVRVGGVLFLTACTAGVAWIAWLLDLVSGTAGAVIGLAGFIAALLIVYRGMFRMLRGVDDTLWELGAELPRIAGFLRGYRRRRQVADRRFQSVRGFFYILAVVPIDDTGGGARSAQIARELLNQGYAVVYLHRFPRYETVELGLDFRHPNLVTSSLQDFDLLKWMHRFEHFLPGKTLGALIELPAANFLPVLRQLRQQGFVLAYDLLDDWDTSLGADWYRTEVELEVVDISQLLAATAPSLVSRLEEISDRPVLELPNAVNSALFRPERLYIRPSDLPPAAWLATYIGALWGEWFDWDLLLEVSGRYPDAGLVLIGDYAGQCPRPAPNLHFLGLKSQRELPAYLAYTDVAIIPWKVNDITRATSPLKLYEYLAMHKPAVTPNIPTLDGIPGVYQASDFDDFTAAVGRIRTQAFPRQEVDDFIARNDWRARVETLLDQVERQQAGEVIRGE